MKTILISIINFYQKFIYITLKSVFGINPACRFEETCSHYAKNSILEHGPIKGVSMSFIRLLKCQPFYKGN